MDTISAISGAIEATGKALTPVIADAVKQKYYSLRKKRIEEFDEILGSNDYDSNRLRVFVNELLNDAGYSAGLSDKSIEIPLGAFTAIIGALIESEYNNHLIQHLTFK